MFETPVTIVNVAVPVPLRKTFDYFLDPQITEGFDNDTKLHPGQRVLVPFGRQQLIAIIVEVKSETDVDLQQLKAVAQVFDDEATFSKEDLKLLHWASNYYQHPIGDVFSAALPGSLRQAVNLSELKEKRLVASQNLPIESELASNAKQLKKLLSLLKESEYTRAELSAKDIKSTTIKSAIDKKWCDWQIVDSTVKTVIEENCNESLQLNPEQAIALAAVNQSNGFEAFLLDGVTGSGKTEVYLQAIQQVLLKQQQILVLVPEIGLTPQTIARFQQRFNVEIVIWHSAMTDKQRFETWLSCRENQAKIVIATRSGVFLPFANLGLIVIDEEHDASFKQQDGFKYHARSLALYRANQYKVPVILGSATPSLESLQNALSGKFHHLLLRQRAGSGQLPTMRLLDLNRCPVDAGIGQPLMEQIGVKLNAGQQVMLFINRRGFAPVLMCEECHWLTECHRCSGYMTYHRGSNQLICHHCGNQHQTVSQCISCGSTRLTSVGLGTEQLDLKLQEQFPHVEVIRLDRDSTSKKGEFERKLEQIHQNKPCIIVGTQMVAKGHHFPNVSLVGIVDVDGTLFSSDFRASEKLAQLVVQVSGRAGRAGIKGEVWLQSRFPEHPVIQDLINNQYADFAKFALQERKMLQLPPFSHQITLRAEATQPELGGRWLQGLMPTLQQYPQLLCLGPTPASMMKKAGKYRYTLSLMCPSRSYLHKVVDWLMQNLDTIQKDNKIRWSIDVDPTDIN